MDINSINSSSIYGTQAKVDERRLESKTEESTKASTSKQVDTLELSEEAKLSKLLEYNSIRDRIKSGFYDNPEVLQEVAMRLSNDLLVENKD